LRLVDRFMDDELHDQLAAQAVLAKITAATVDDREPLLGSLLGDPDLLDLIAADGVAVSVQHRYETRGQVPSEDDVRAVAAWAASMGEEVVDTDSLAGSFPELEIAADVAAGVLAITLPDGQFAMWFRAEALRSVDWGGDPANKAIAVGEGDEVRLSPRKSFERWRETISDRCTPWTTTDVATAAQLRRYLVEAMYQRTRAELRTTETLQRSLLPAALPRLSGWDLSAHYEPAAGGRIGGDWYDAFVLRDRRLVMVLGDVAGHGIGAAGTMAQLRNALRAYLFDGLEPDEALSRLNDFSNHLLPGAFATAVVACVDLVSGDVRAASAGHPTPLVIPPGAPAAPAALRVSPPLGVTRVAYVADEFTLVPDAELVFFSDGLVERRDEALDVGLAQLARALTDLGAVSARTVWERAARGDVADDVTVLALHRPAGPAPR
jgi:chemotaxis family two-component system sensor kinase Cph1